MSRLESRRLAEFYLRYRKQFYDPSLEFDAVVFEQAAEEKQVSRLLKISPCHLTRARAHHRLCLTMISAVRLVVALQLHQRQHGIYPPSLKELEYEPVELVSPGGDFVYRLQGDEFTLTSDSPFYKRVDWNDHQSFYPYRSICPTYD